MLPLLRVEQQAVAEIAAAQLAVVLGQSVVAGGKAARGEGERHAAEGKELGLQASGANSVHGGMRFAAHLHRCGPTLSTEVAEQCERFTVVGIEMWAGNKRYMLFGQQPYRTHVVGLHTEAAVVDDVTQSEQLRLRLDERECG